MGEKNFYKDFTNLYELSKTLRFELKPIWSTQKLLDENQVFLKDKIRQNKYEKIKPFLNEFHIKFIEFCLKDLSLDYTEYKKSLDEYQKDRKNKETEKNKINEEKKLREQIVNKFKEKTLDFLKTFWEIEIIKWKKNNHKIKILLWDNWSIEFNKNDYEFLFESQIFELMKKEFVGKWDIYVTNKETWEIYINEKTWKDLTIFDNWDWWLWYLTKFFETRKNLYKSDWTQTALATRIINENLKKFSNNLDIYNKLKVKEELKIKFKNLENDFNINIEDFFRLNNYNNYVLQNWINKYNEIIWWKLIIENNKKIPWINEYINKYRQNTWDKIPFLQKLDKQILAWWKEVFIEQIENESAFKNILENFYNNSVKKVEILSYIFWNLINYNNEEYKTIYISKEAFNTISHKFTDQISIFEKNVFNELLKDKLVGKKDYEKKEEKDRFPDFIPLFYIKKGLENYIEEDLFFKSRYYENNIIEENNEDIWEKFCNILNYEFNSLLSNTITNQNWEEVEIWFNILRKKLERLLDNFSLWETNDWIIKDFADVSKKIYQMWKYFAIEKKREWNNNYDLNSDFYNSLYSEENKKYWYLEFYTEAYEDIINSYNLMRNYIAKKPWEDSKKWKLNFECSNLLSWWDKNFEGYWSYIFKKDWLYYLWIINWKKITKEESEKLYKYNDISLAERFVYDFQKPDNKNTPRLFIRSKWDSFSPAVSELNLPINNILEIYDKELYKINKNNPNKHKPYLEKLINYFKEWFTKHKSYKHFNFVWKNSKEYENIADFYVDVEKSCYKPYWENINFEELIELTKNRIYLFQIYNKNYQLDKNIAPKNYIFQWNWKDNIHTLYFKWLFQTENLENKNWVNIKLSWWWEVFFRPKIGINKLWKKKDRSWKEIINNKRYSEDKIFLHFPIQLNFKENKTKNFNLFTNNFLANNKDINIIWIDRWEKHLAYFSVINQKWEILESWSLNYIYQKDKNWNTIQKKEKEIKEIKNDEWKIIDYELIETWKEIDYEDYWLLLEYKEKKRRLERQSWKEVEQIKDLKKWYISAVVRKIADLIIKYNAIVIFEDLNMRFKQIRWWIEKSIYQQLEKALIDKLNFLVEKWEYDKNKAWNLLKAYQLTFPIESFKDMWKQNWIVFYTNASYTSKIDPLTWWRPNLYIKKQSAELNKENILKFKNIIWNNDFFEITYDLKDFQKAETTNILNKTNWTLCTCVERYKWNKNLNNNKWWYNHFDNLTNNFKELFEEYNININWNIIKQIHNLETKWNEKFFSNFLDYFSLLCQIRNTNDSKSWNENDFILSPIKPFFDSRKSKDFWKYLPKNWDDNWAYNIAKKWILILNKISEWKKVNTKKNPELFISNTDWDNFTQS